MPLGIELAAAWVRALSPDAIAGEISRSLDILETPARNVEARHRTMRAAIEPTWERLTDTERDAFMRLSVFRGGFTREAAEAVAGASLRTLTALVDKSLVRVDERGRYDLHELLRQYAAEELREAGETEAAADSHLAYFLSFAEQVEAHNFGREQVAWYDRAEAEWDNIHAAFDRSEHTETGLRIAAALGWFFSERSHWLKGFSLLKRAIAANPDAPASLRAKAFHSAAPLARHFGSEDETVAYCEQALALARPIDDRWNIAWALAHGAMVLWDDFPRQQVMLEEALALFRALDDKMGMTHTLVRRFWTAFDQDDYDLMRVLLDEAQARAHEAGDLIMSGWVLSIRGQTAWRVGNDLKQAYDYFERSLKIFNEAHFHIGVRHAVIFLSEVQPNLLSVENAQTLNETALRWLREIAPGHRNTAFILTMLAEAAAVQGQIERAGRLLGAASRQDFVDYSPEATDRFNKNVADVCALLGDEAFAQAWTAGSSMSFAEVVAYAIESSADAPSTVPAAPSMPSAHDARPLDVVLTRREVDILRLIADGYSNGEIADQLVLATSTVKWYVSQILSKLEAKSRTQAVSRARALGLLD
jgi:DNA-binding CsgD family transcriptional regulator/tetratricopeptide (TPR) repeat protein